MKKPFSIALIIQILCVLLFMIHSITYFSLNYQLIIGICSLSFVVGCYLLWNAFRNPDVMGAQKTLGIVLGILPILCILFMIFLLLTIRC